ncbi:hypothetical protein DYD21_16755 [Rhodohalobacter sp. SW132]|uniref:hypothetical protein n=1 Tax=Rhodohalobacter sp. SW132 TaxID=2293433 RepID=UPI000E2892A9|nr:hypothetical protein [Rhodohalobacter sp. SW132]REL24810.1 hypothetical protein DYD21_16755 [Rhodohalobacter sp. SW132]
MMSRLNTPKGIFLDLLYLAETGSGFVKQTIPESIFIDYLKLSGRYEQLKQQVGKNFERITKDRFQKEYPPESWPRVDKKIETFSRKLNQFDYDNDVISNYHHYDDEYIKNAYQYYCDKTGHIYGKSISAKSISNRDSIKMVNMIEAIGGAILLRETLQEVQDHLEFNDIYSPIDELQKFDKVADACWKFFNDNESITQEEILFRIKFKSYFTNYAHLPTKEAKKKASEAAKQWFRDVKKSSGIEIPK